MSTPLWILAHGESLQVSLFFGLMAERVRVLTPGGYFVVTDLVAPRWGVAIADRAGRRYRLATADALRQVAQALGLETVRESTSFAAFDAAWRRSR